MADETPVVQTPDVETGSSQPQEEVTLDSFLGIDEPSQPVPAKEDKRDFKQWAEKEKSRADKLEAELKTLREQPQQQATPENLADDPGVKILEEIIGKAVEQRIGAAIAPLTNQQQRNDQQAVWDEYSQDPIFKTLAPQVKAVYDSLPVKTGNFKQDMEFAYNYTKGKYQDDITRAAREVGQEEGFKGRNLKQSGGLVGRATTPTTTDDFERRYRDGTLSNQEFAENQDRITEIDRADRAAGR